MLIDAVELRGGQYIRLVLIPDKSNTYTENTSIEIRFNLFLLVTHQTQIKL